MHLERKHKYCEQCRVELDQLEIEGRLRDYCPKCKNIYYKNPLPVASAIIVNEDREVLLVLRDREPHKGEWCLPSGFAELDESIEESALRELKEEAGIDGEIKRLLDTCSLVDEFYGDLIWVTYEVAWISGDLKPGDDARDASFFPIHELPTLAFSSNEHALKVYLKYYRDIWQLEDSMYAFHEQSIDAGEGLPSDTLFESMILDSHIISENWTSDVFSNPTTPHYVNRPHEEVYNIAHRIISEFGNWIIHPERDQEEIWATYRQIGRDRKKEGYRLSEVLSAFSLSRKHIFAHVLAQGGIWNKPLEVFRVMEFMSRVNLFYDKGSYHICRGYENEMTPTSTGNV